MDERLNTIQSNEAPCFIHTFFTIGMLKLRDTVNKTEKLYVNVYNNAQHVAA